VSALVALAKAEAAQSGRAQLVSTVRHVHLADRPLVLIALTLAGEANAPLAAMIGDSPGSARLLVVDQPRNRDQRFAFAAELAGIVLGHFASTDVPQLLVPNPATIGFVRLLGRSTRFRRPTGEHAVDPAVPLLGRWLTCYAEQAERPGSCLLLAATDALALHWATGQSAVEDLNLAALLGWIDPPPGLTGPQAARAAEDPLTWPPAGPATDPTFDNEILAPLISACSNPEISSRRRELAITNLHNAIAGQLAPTWRLMWRAVELLKSLPPGGHVGRRWDADRDAFVKYGEHVRDGGPPQPRRDSAVAAAQRLSWLEQQQASYTAQRAFDDPLVLAQYRLTGEAFGGEVIAAEPDRIDGSGPRRKLRPLITLVTEDLFRVDVGALVISPTRPSQEARVTSVTEQPAGSVVELELSKGMGRSLTAPPGSVPVVGERVCYTTLSDAWQVRGVFPERENTPWTHGGPPPVYLPTPEDQTEAWS